MKIEIKEYSEKYKSWAGHFLRKNWFSTEAVSRGNIYQADTLPGFVALMDGKPVGLITYHVRNNDCEIVTLNSGIERKGIGTALIEAVKKAAVSKMYFRLWLITTNDNIEAIRFYQKKGFELAAIHRNSIDQSRKLKPSIPLIGKHGILVRDEVEFEIKL